MEITFEKVNNEYIAEFEITTDSNLHIEKKCASSTKLYQRTNGCGWDLVDGTKNMQGAVDDFDLSALVYPKFIKVVCNAEPLYAEVTTSGGGEASGEDVLFFDGQILYNTFGHDLATMFGTILGNSSFINKTTYYMENYAGRLPWSEGSFLNGGDLTNLRYVCVSNSLTPTVVMMGSGTQEIPKQDKPITVYEFFEILAGIGMELPVDVFKAAEVSREVVEQWMQE